MSQRTLTIIVILALVLIAGILIWWFLLRDQCDPHNPGYTKKGKLSDRCFGEAQDPKTISDPPPAGCTWISDAFPLRKCMSGNKVKALQTALGITADGKFGNQTENAVKAKFNGRTEVNEAEYNALINPPASGGGLNFTNLKKALGTSAKDFSGGVYTDISGQNRTYSFSFWTNGRFFMSEKDQTVVLKKGSYKDGGEDFILDDTGTVYTVCDAATCTLKQHIYANMQKVISDYEA